MKQFQFRLRIQRQDVFLSWDPSVPANIQTRWIFFVIRHLISIQVLIQTHCCWHELRINPQTDFSCLYFMFKTVQWNDEFEIRWIDHVFLHWFLQCLCDLNKGWCLCRKPLQCDSNEGGACDVRSSSSHMRRVSPGSPLHPQSLNEWERHEYSKPPTSRTPRSCSGLPIWQVCTPNKYLGYRIWRQCPAPARMYNRFNLPLIHLYHLLWRFKRKANAINSCISQLLRIQTKRWSS